MNWSVVSDLDKILREKYIYIYIWAVNGLYVAYEVIKAIGGWGLQAGERGLISSFSLTPLPAFLIFGFLQAILYSAAHHVYKSSAPDSIKSGMSRPEIEKELSASRKIIREAAVDFVEDAYQLKKSSLKAEGERLSKEITPEEASRMIDEFVHLSFSQEREQIFLKAEREANALTYSSIMRSKPAIMIFCLLTYIGSGVFGALHVAKVCVWALGLF